LLKFFVPEAITRSAAGLLYQKIRQIIAQHLSQKSAWMFDGDIELDRNYFGGAREEKRGRRAAGKVIYFGILNASWQGLTQRWSTTPRSAL